MGKRVKGSRHNRKVEFSVVLKALLDLDRPFAPKYLHNLSDLSPEHVSELSKIWLDIPISRRLALLEDLEELQDADTRLWFEPIARLALEDPEPDARTRAISLLWEAADEEIIPIYISLSLHDPAVEVRAAAVWGLGYYIYAGELEELDIELKPIEDHLIAIAGGSDDMLVRRRAVESMGFSSRDEVAALIEAAFKSTESDMVSSALFAMGRSYDSARYENDVRQMLKHPKFEVQLEAIRAAGELALSTTLRALFDILEQEALDPDIRDAALWALSQIGGEQVEETLDDWLQKAENDEDEEFILNAIDNLALTEQVNKMDMLDIDLLDEENLDHIIDLEDEANPEDDKDEDLNSEESPRPS